MPRVGIESTSLEFRVTVVPLRHIDSLMSPLDPRLPVCAASCVRGQCRLLKYQLLPVYYMCYNQLYEIKNIVDGKNDIIKPQLAIFRWCAGPITLKGDRMSAIKHRTF